MQSLPSSAWLRLVLACYLLVLGIAGMSPQAHAQRMEVVCTSDGAMKMVPMEGAAATHTLDCALCLAAALPAPQASTAASMPQPRAPAPVHAAGPPMAGPGGARFPPRGPPAQA